MSGSIALLDNGNLTAEWTLSSAKTHNRRLLQSIDRLLAEVGWELKSIDAFAVASGPGSFTGLRIGMTTMKVLAWTLARPYVTVCSLDALALPFSFAAHPICALLDARKNEVYCALFRPDGKGALSRETAYSAMAPSKLAQTLASRPAEPVIFCGDGWKAYREIFEERLGELAIVPPPSFHLVRASSVAEIAERMFLSGRSEDPRSSAPLYIRPSEAEIHYPHLAEKSSGKPQII